jgi:hypothetical protein
MTRFYTHYKNWEDWKAGMYLSRVDKDKALQCAELLSNQSTFLDVAMRMISTWDIASAVNLSNNSRNRQAWIGQASCCFALGANENTTIMGWRMMSEESQKQANETADAVINYYERIKGVNPCQNVIWA